MQWKVGPYLHYLKQKNFACTEYWCYPDDELDKILCKFWFNVWTTKPPREDENDSNHPELYTIASLRNLCNGMSRELQGHVRNIDLTTDTKYTKSRKCFLDACKELKEKGKDIVWSYPEIHHKGKVLVSIFTLNFFIVKHCSTHNLTF